MKKTYSNFQHPLKLMMRMLLSKDRAAHSALFRAGLGLLIQPLDALLEPLERRRLQTAQSSALPIILIVGAPRSGTTLVYQTLARFLLVSYFTNFSALFPRAPITASRWFQRIYKQKNFDDRNFYGNVAGASAPNDGFHVWNRWLGADRYQTPQQISAAAKQEMKNFFNAWLSAFNQPLINKNNRNTDCVALLASILDNLYFIEVQRDPVYVVQSLLEARLRIQGSKDIGWGLRSRQTLNGRNGLQHVDDVCDQVFEIEMKLQEDKQHVAPERLVRVSYEQFCQNPRYGLRQISQKIPGTAIDEEALRGELKPFRVTNEIRVAVNEFARIKSRLGELYGAAFSSRFEGHSSAALSTALV